MNKRIIWVSWCALLLIATTAVRAGSVYNEWTYEGLTSDLTARSVGDVLAVLIFEDATAVASAGAQTNSSGDASAELRDKNDALSAGLGFSNDFSGEAAINRSGRLVARVSVIVDRVLDNGDLVVSGTQVIRFNQETQSIRIQGRVRPEDLTNANTVLSTRLADATIEYTGEGLLGDSERPGWLSRFLSRIF